MLRVFEVVHPDRVAEHQNGEGHDSQVHISLELVAVSYQDDCYKYANAVDTLHYFGFQDLVLVQESSLDLLELEPEVAYDYEDIEASDYFRALFPILIHSFMFRLGVWNLFLNEFVRFGDDT